MEGFTQRVTVSPAYDFRPEHTHRPGDYGIGACRVTFVLIGPKGAVQFMIGTDWYTESARQHLAKFPRRPLHQEREPDGWDLGYHSPVEKYEGQGSRPCDLLPGGECFYDGSGLNADEMVEAFINGGTEWLWPHLEKYYRCTFEGAEFPEPVVTPRAHPDDRKKIA